MGRTYYQIGNKRAEFDFNVAGVDLFGCLHAEFGAKVLRWVDALPDQEAFKRDHPESWDFFSKKVDLPGRFSRDEARASADALDAASEDALRMFIKRRDQAGKWGDSPQDFVVHVRRWARYLRSAKRGLDCF